MITYADATTRRLLTPEEREAIEDVIDAAVAWEAGELPTAEAASIGTALNPRGNPSPAWTRGLAYRHLSQTGQWDSAERRALEALTDTIGAAEYVRLPDGSRVPRHEWNTNERDVQAWQRNGGKAA